MWIGINEIVFPKNKKKLTPLLPLLLKEKQYQIQETLRNALISSSQKLAQIYKTRSHPLENSIHTTF